MASKSPGLKLHGSSKKSGLTQTAKVHRFEPFSKRIARIKIDPIHSVQQSRISNDPSDLSESYFRLSLNEWAELNLTATFTSFLNKVNPLSENLPQLVHHADAIFELLMQHIDRTDELALEPLLSLSAHFAHDLGRSFEKYFIRTVETVVNVSATVQDAAVIESCFTCLAWMFKYLSKVLLQDLRPLLELMLPCLSMKMDYLRRFSAESLAFLVRKAAILSSKNPEPLQIALQFLFDHLAKCPEGNELAAYEYALMNLIAESATGVEAQLHPSSMNLMLQIYESLSKRPALVSARSLSVLQGTVVNLIHQTDADGFSPLSQFIVQHAQDSSESQPWLDKLVKELLLALIGTRKGSRVSDWAATLAAIMSSAARTFGKNSSTMNIEQTSLSTLAAALQYSPMDQLLPLLNTDLDSVIGMLDTKNFILLCDLVSELGQQRFQDILLPRLQKCILRHWRDGEDSLIFLLAKLRRQSNSTPKFAISNSMIFMEWEEDMSRRLQLASSETGFAASVANLFLLMEIAELPKDPNLTVSMREGFFVIIKNTLEGTSGMENFESRLTLGWAFKSLLNMGLSNGDQMLQLLRLIVNAPKEGFSLLPFVHACRILLDKSPADLIDKLPTETMILALVDNMLCPHVELRKLSIEIMLQMGKMMKNKWLSDTMEAFLVILDTPYLPSTTREIAMYVRRLPAYHRESPQNSALQKAVPLFAMGLLHTYHDQSRRDVCDALSQMKDHAHADDVIVDVMMSWLQGSYSQSYLQVEPASDEPGKKLSLFECSNLLAIQRYTEKIGQEYQDVKMRLKQFAQKAHELQLIQPPMNGRSIAIQVFSAMPELAEKRSRALVPAFLSIQHAESDPDLTSTEASMSSHTLSPDIITQSWSLNDKKALLELFTHFVNPRVLYRATDTYEGLVEFLTNGNPEIRNLAFTAILLWKDPCLQRYSEILLKVAQANAATSELALLLSEDVDISSIRPSDRQTVLPILLRLIFGQLIGHSGAPGSQEAKRKSLLRSMFRMQQHEIHLFLDIALGRLRKLNLLEEQSQRDQIFAHDLLNRDQQHGFLKMVLSMVSTLESQFSPYGPRLIDAVLYCTIRGHRQSCHVGQPESTTSSSLIRNLRRSGLQCLVLLFKHCDEVDWRKYGTIIIAEIFNPRMNTLGTEISQGVSTLLHLLSTWASSPKFLPLLLELNPRLTLEVWKALGLTTARNDVKVFILERILMPLLETVTGDIELSNTRTSILHQEIPGILSAMKNVLQDDPDREILFASTKIIPLLSAHAVNESTANGVLNLLINILCEPSKSLPPHIRGGVLQATASLLTSQTTQIDESLIAKLYDVVSELYNYFTDNVNREVLSTLLMTLAGDDKILQGRIRLCQELNSYTNNALDTIDYDRRLAAFDALTSLTEVGGTRRQWSPLLHNLLFFARASEDYAIRSNAVRCLRSYISKSSVSGEAELTSLVHEILLPALRKGVKADSELVRADFVALFGATVKHLHDDSNTRDLKVLLVGDDEEADFFLNILHIQQHRRLRALRRLTTAVQKGLIRTTHIADYFLPLLSKFINDDNVDESAQSIKGQSIAATSVLLQWVEWKNFRQVLRQYKQDLGTKSRAEKDTIKLLANACDALTTAVQCAQTADSDDEVYPVLASTLPSKEVLWAELTTHIIPKLSGFIHHKDEAEVSFRIPAAKIAVKFVKLLPMDKTETIVAPILLDISQILRSRAQESRDVARNTLAEIVALIGPSSLQFVLKELRTALTRGYQLHVLGYTLHTILLQLAPHLQPGDLDYCIEDLIAVIMDDVFGVVGQEKENQDYISSMKEVKSSKSQNSIEIIAASTGVRSLSKLLKPFQPLLHGKLTTKQLRQVDDLIRRIGVGISHNPAASSQELLVFCYELMQNFYKQKTNALEPVETNQERNRSRFIVQLESRSKSSPSDANVLTHKLARFALDLVRSALLKHASLMTAENVHGLVHTIGDAIIEGQQEVKVSAIRLLSAVVKLPIEEFNRNATLYVLEATKIVKDSISTNEEASQAALKLITAILREKKEVQVRDSDIAYLLQRTTPDLEEPDRQGVTFNFIKAVMARKYQLPEVYELADKVGKIMVTSQNRTSRDASRGVYVHFLLDYPQSKNRWSKQLKFLVKNLEYQYHEGRQSVMEAMNMLIQKIDVNLASDIVSTFSLPVTLRIANDEHYPCREMAGVLLVQLYRKASTSDLKALLEPIRGWTEQSENTALNKLSMQTWNVLLDVETFDAELNIPHIRAAIARTMQMEADKEDQWELQHRSLELLQKLTIRHPSMMATSKQRNIWIRIHELLNSQYAEVQKSAADLLNTIFHTCADSGGGKLKIPLIGTHGLKFDAAMITAILQNSIRVMKGNQGNQDLSRKIMQNLGFLGKLSAVNDLRVPVARRSATGGKKGTADTSDPSSNEEEQLELTSIPASQYILDQCTRILRREPSRHTSATFLPRLCALQLLSTMVPQLAAAAAAANDSTKLPEQTLADILTPLTHITDPSSVPPRSADPTFPTTFTAYTDGANNLLETIQKTVGDERYVQLMTLVSRKIRGRREERRQKRAIERVAEPEKAARDKKRKAERTRERRKVIVDLYRKGRRRDLGF